MTFSLGESPSSSASDIDNLNNQALVEKAFLSKSNGLHPGNHVIAPRNHPSIFRLLDFVSLLMLIQYLLRFMYPSLALYDCLLRLT